MDVLNQQPSDQERTLAGIAHLLILASIYGVLLSLVIWWRERERSRYVAFQAAQAMIYQFGVYVLSILLAFAVIVVVWLPFIWVGPPVPDVSPEGEVFTAVRIFTFVFVLVVTIGIVMMALLLSLAAIVYAVYGAVRCFQGRPFRYLLVGPVAERLVPPASPSGGSEPAAF